MYPKQKGGGSGAPRIRRPGLRRAAALAALAAGVACVLGGMSPVEAYAWVRFEAENGSPVVESGGTWSSVANASHSAGNVRRALSASMVSTMTCPANTTGVRVIAPKTNSLGIFNVSVDGGSATAVDQYSASASFQQVVFEATGLSAGSHTVVVTTTGTKNALSSSTTVYLDAFECNYELPPTTTTTEAPTTTTTVAPTTTTLCGASELHPCVVALGSYEANVGVVSVAGLLGGAGFTMLLLNGIRFYKGV